MTNCPFARNHGVQMILLLQILFRTQNTIMFKGTSFGSSTLFSYRWEHLQLSDKPEEYFGVSRSLGPGCFIGLHPNANGEPYPFGPNWLHIGTFRGTPANSFRRQIIPPLVKRAHDKGLLGIPF